MNNLIRASLEERSSSAMKDWPCCGSETRVARILELFLTPSWDRVWGGTASFSCLRILPAQMRLME